MEKPEKTLPPTQRAISRLTGARLCFGRAVEVKGRTVIPVASVQTAGGYGFGNETNGGGTGAGGGGALNARPIGFIEIGPDGTRFERIDDGLTTLRVIALSSMALVLLSRMLLGRRHGLLRGGVSRPRGGRLSRPRRRRSAHASQGS